MHLKDIPAGALCFIDANIFYYHLVEFPSLSQACSDFLERVEHGEIEGVTSSAMMAEALHKVMLAEAVAKFGLSRKGLAHYLQRHRHLIPQLGKHRSVIQAIVGINIKVEAVTLDVLTQAAEIAVREQLLINDATTLALMYMREITHLATNDDNFDSVSGIQVWKPR